MKKVLILGYKDSTLEGHALSIYKKIETKCEAQIICYVAFGEEKDLESFVSAKSKGLARINYLLYRFRSKRIFIKNEKNKKQNTDEYCFFNSSFFFAKNAHQILKKAGSKPDIIIICLHDLFISPKTIYDLYDLTNAQVVVLMVDPYVMTGGCHYPIECKQYLTGCVSCPALIDGKVAKKLYDERVEYLSKTPLTLVGTSYDLDRARGCAFLRDKQMIKWLGMPAIPFVRTRCEARRLLNIPDDDFVIIAGSGSLKDKRKGFSYLYDALKIFNDNLNENKGVTFLLLGKDGGNELDFGDNIKVLRPGFLDTNGLINAFYASDVFCSTSIDDSGPYMINYSIACGVPVVSFPVGVAVDLVNHCNTGYLADFKDSISIKNGLLLFYNMSNDEWIKYSDNCKQLCDEIKNTEPWYDQLLNM